MTRCKLGVLGHIGGAGELALMPNNQSAVPGWNQVALDGVGPHLEGQFKGLQGVFGTVSGRTSVPEDQWKFHGFSLSSKCQVRGLR